MAITNKHYANALVTIWDNIQNEYTENLEDLSEEAISFVIGDYIDSHWEDLLRAYLDDLRA